MAESDFSKTPYSQPTAIPYASVSRLVWGDRESGEVADWTYVSSDKIHQLLFGMPPGGSFRHSDRFRTIFAADILYHVLSGTLAMSNPETGEAVIVNPGESVFFRRDTWHHGHNYSTEPLRVIEYFAPPPAQGTSRKYAQTKQSLTRLVTAQDEYVGRWPMDRDQADRARSLHHLGPGDSLVRLEGTAQEALVELFVSTEHLTAGKLTLLPGRRTESRAYGGDLALYLMEGELFVRAGAEGSQTAFEVRPQDGAYLPSGVPVEFFNYGRETCRFLFGVAPSYLAHRPS